MTDTNREALSICGELREEAMLLNAIRAVCGHPPRSPADSLCCKAADRIEELVEALERISKSSMDDMTTLHPIACSRIARNALAKIRGKQ